MTKTVYLDCFSGIAGNMMLAALLDVGVRQKDLLPLLRQSVDAPFAFRVRRVQRGFLSAKSVTVEVKQEKTQSYKKIQQRIKGSPLPNRVKEDALRCFELLAKAEAKVHGRKVSQVHFHEVGQTDALVDILGSALALHLLGVEKIFCSPVNLGSGTVSFSHGESPVPAPATAELLRGFPVYQRGDRERTTPTGAALLKGLTQPVKGMPEMVVQAVGYGAGANLKGSPNVLRLFLGKGEGKGGETIVELTTVIDDMMPHLLSAHLSLLRAHCLDIYLRPVVMKKERLGTEVVLLCSIEREEDLLRALFETTALGVRRRRIERIALPRKTITLASSLGRIRVKTAAYEKKVTIVPEMDDCLKIAKRKKMSLVQVVAIVQAEARKFIESTSGEDE